MANTTFKGPVRSQNGFQEWDGSAWVPIGGGGGSAVLAESDGQIVTLPFTTPGQIISVTNKAGSVGTYTLAIAPIPGVTIYAVDGGLFSYSGTFNGIGTSFPLPVSLDATSTFFQVCYKGNYTLGTDVVASFIIFGMGQLDF